MRSHLLLASVIFSASVASADCIYDIDSEAALIRSNICSFENSALVRIESVEERESFDKSAPHRLFEFRGIVTELYKGSMPELICLIQLREHPFGIDGIEGRSFVVSVNKSESGCFAVETGAMVEATDELTGIARDESLAER